MADFLGIGAQKAGTTWLYRNLARHPQVRFPAGKEVHFWNRRREKGVDWWLALFSEEPGGIRQGEITPAYALLDTACIAEIARHCPAVQVFFSVRNPIERAWSAALMALERAEMCVEEASDQWFIDHFRSRGSLARGDYAACLERWWAVFERDRIQVIDFDEIRSNPRGVLERLAAHIDVDPAFFAALPAGELSAGVFTGPGLPIRPSLVDTLRELYAGRVEALAATLERDLSHWQDGRGAAT